MMVLYYGDPVCVCTLNAPVLVLLSNDTQLASNLNEGIGSPADLLLSVGSGELDTDTGLALGDNWVGEANDVDTTLQHLVGKLASKTSIAQHDGRDWVVVTLGVDR